MKIETENSQHAFYLCSREGKLGDSLKLIFSYDAIVLHVYRMICTVIKRVDKNHTNEKMKHTTKNTKCVLK